MTGGWKISDFAAMIAVLGVVALVGLSDNERTIRRNLDAGYATSAMITGAHEQRRFPLTFDGLRPRLLDQVHSLDLTWRGPDGTERTRQKVPVSDQYLAPLMVGDKVRLVRVPIKVVDEQEAVPTIVPDADARLNYMNGFATWVRYGAAIAAFIFVVSFGTRWWQRNRGVLAGAGPGLEPTAWHIPPRLTILTVVCLGMAGMMGYFSLRDGWATAAIRAHGSDTTAAITGLHATVGRDRTISYTIDLAWRDGSGAERHFGPTHISDAYAQRISAGGVLTARQTAIRYLEEDPSARPLIVADADERTKQDGIGQAMTAVLAVAGIALAAITVWRSRRA